MPVAQPVVVESIAQSMLAEFEIQARVTRRFLERLPEDKLTWKPHERSMTAGQLAYHIAWTPGAVVRFVQETSKQVGNFSFPQPASLREVLDTFEESIASVREILPTYDDAAMDETWRLLKDDQELITTQRGLFLRDIMLSHCYQHRGQFCVYLRLLDVPVPSSWGPSADEQPPFMR